MTDWSLPNSLLDQDPVDGNPFPPNDQRHDVWQEATAEAEAAVSRLISKFMMLSVPRNATEYQRQVTWLTVEQFNIWAERGLRVVWDADNIEPYEQWLLAYANAHIEKRANQRTYPSDLCVEDLVIELRRALTACVMHWRAEVRDFVAAVGQSGPVAAAATLAVIDNSDSETSRSPRDRVDTPYNPDLPSQDDNPQNDLPISTKDSKASHEDVVSFRKRLLEEYRAAMGGVAHKRLYEARNSGIHKPQFYAWLNGTLPPESATSRNFEKFLREQRPPIPRKPSS